MTQAITFDDVRLSFNGQRIYQSVSFDVAEREFVCLLGPSGCGKSTALRLMGDLLPADGGSITVAGKAPALAWQDISFVFQSPRLAPWRTALANVLLGAELRFGRQRGRELTERAAQLLALVGLADSGGKYPLMLSGGERQRVAIARALLVDPSIVLMDEPFSALDPNTRTRMRAEIERIWQQTHKTIVFVTHDIDEALVLADRIVLMSTKPTTVLQTVVVDAPRPRDLSGNERLRQLREHLQQLFRSLEPAVDSQSATHNN